MSRSARLPCCAGVLVATLSAMSGCDGAPDPRCPGSAHACPAESARWPIRTTAAPTYRVEEDVVTDQTTGLMWQRRVPREMFRWTRANDYCEELELGGNSDWRLPSRIELVSLLEYERLELAADVAKVPEAMLDRAAFPEAPPAEYWTASYFGDPLEAWTVSFARGTFSLEPGELLLPRVRCVRTERDVSSTSGSSDSESTRFSVGPETATERATGLTWQRKRGPSSTNEEAAQYCAGLTLDGRGGFRLPHVKELVTLAAGTTAGDAVDADVFDASRYSYDGRTWTSTPAGLGSFRDVSYASFFLVDLSLGGRIVTDASFNDEKKTMVAPVRCVRGASAPASAAPRPDEGSRP